MNVCQLWISLCLCEIRIFLFGLFTFARLPDNSTSPHGNVYQQFNIRHTVMASLNCQAFLKSSQRLNDENKLKCGPKFWQNSNFRAFLTSSHTCHFWIGFGRTDRAALEKRAKIRFFAKILEQLLYILVKSALISFFYRRTEVLL